jgi:putative phosphoribosyl transferase
MHRTRQFSDRAEAGARLGEELRDRGIDADIVLAIPRGALPLGRAVADALAAPLDVVVAQKIGARGNPEYAIGAVASDGSTWRNDEAFRVRDIDEEYFEREAAEKAEQAREKAKRYRGDEELPDLTDKRVVVVDDGVATGSTARACLRTLFNSDPERVVLAVPVGPPETMSELRDIADQVLVLETPSDFRGVGQFYERFDQVSDEKAMAYLDEKAGHVKDGNH